MRELFVYYRVREADAAAAREAVSAMQNELRSAHPGLRARLLTRQGAGAGAGAGAQTWMETYSLGTGSEGVDAAFEALIETRAASLACLIDGSRHVEAFSADDSA